MDVSRGPGLWVMITWPSFSTHNATDTALVKVINHCRVANPIGSFLYFWQHWCNWHFFPLEISLSWSVQSELSLPLFIGYSLTLFFASSSLINKVVPHLYLSPRWSFLSFFKKKLFSELQVQRVDFMAHYRVKVPFLFYLNISSSCPTPFLLSYP